MKKKLFTNIGASVFCNIILLLLSLIVPRLFLLNYGSDTNGLLTTLSQIFAYVALLEAGISQATVVQLYGPLKNKDQSQISKVMSISRHYYREVTFIYAMLVGILAVLLPFVVKSELNYWTIFLCVIFEGAAGVVHFFFFSAQTILLSADGKGYVNEIINLFGKTASYAVKIFLAIFGLNIVFIQFGAFIISLSKTVFYLFYFRKNYPWVDYSVNYRKSEKLPDRNAFVVSELAWTIFSSTDAIVLSVFCSTKLASVYSVNNMAFVAINSLVSSAYFGVRYVLGKAYHESIERYTMVHDCFNAMFMAIITACMGVAILLMGSFITLYTNGVEDISYSYKWLPILFCMVQMLSWDRYIAGNLTGIAGYAKPVSKISLFEALANITFSLILVSIWGIYGVVLATVFALPVKVLYTNYIADKVIMNRHGFYTLSKLSIDYILLLVVLVISVHHPLMCSNWISFFAYGAVLGITLLCIVSVIHLMIYKNFRKKVVDIMGRQFSDM